MNFHLKISEKIQIKKTISWTIISLIVVTGIGWIYYGNFIQGIGLGLADRVLKIGMYYVHERFWHGKYKEAKKAAK